MKNIRTIILAAGKGTRMKSETPKVLHQACGVPIIQYVLDVAKAIGSMKTVVVLGHKGDTVKEYLGKDQTVVSQSRLKGTADAVKICARYFKNYRGDVVVMCGDTPLLKASTVKELIKKHKKTKAACTFLTSVLHDPQGYGRVIRAENGAAVAIREDKDAAGIEREIAEINAGAYCFKSKDLFDAVKNVKLNQKKKEFYLTDLIEIFSSNGLKVETYATEDTTEGLGINTKEDLAVAASVLRKRILSALMRQGVTIVDPQNTYVEKDVKIGADTTIHPFSFIESQVRIGSRCSIGPFARLRSGTKIGNNVEVGNFVEISRSRVGNKCFIKHFGYVGDSTIGAHANIGAGAVTANFDGEKKNPTRIGDHAFIGSNSVLVAPVRIGKNAVVAAGSVVVKKNVPDRSLAVGVPATITKKGRRK